MTTNNRFRFPPSTPNPGSGPAERPTPLELLQSTHRFPGRFTFKVIGRDEADFEARAVAAIRRVVAEGPDPRTSARHTANGKHVAVTIEPEVASAEQVLEIYTELQRLEGLELLL